MEMKLLHGNGETESHSQSFRYALLYSVGVMQVAANHGGGCACAINPW
jgi:hypothetical protein